MTAQQFKPSAVRRRLLLGRAALCVLPPLAGCGGGAELLFIPFISFTFDGIGPGNQSISFSFGTDNPSGCTASGSFTVNSNVTVNGVETSLTGNFNGRRMNIRFAAPPPGLAAAYTGQFVDDATVTLTPDGGGTAFNVVRTFSSPRPSTCPASG